MSLFVKTFENGKRVLDDVKRFLFFLTIAVQCVFFVYYVYSIYVNTSKPVFLFIYSALFILSIVAFINYLVTHKYPKESLKGFSRFLRIFKYFINFSLVAINFFTLIKFGGTFWGVILLISSIISLFFQILIEMIRYIIEQEIKRFKKRQEEKATKIENNTNIKTTLNELKNKFIRK